MAMRAELQVLLGGSGGQGLVLAGSLLAQAAADRGLYAAQTQSYGIAARGGFSSAAVILAPEPILYPYVTAPDVVVILSQEAVGRCLGAVAGRTLVLYDSALGNVVAAGRPVGMPLSTRARELGAPEAVNMIALGAMAALVPDLDPGSLEEAIKARFSGEVQAANLAALRSGYALAKEMEDHER
jgi:2-oxoglutarate ferredoxin oxidoreductase subunit gamma